jgi:anti-anti-sigma regulatory factor
MLRVEVVTHERRTVRVAGRLTGPWATELRRTPDGLAAGPLVDLDLTDVSFVDADGLDVLRALKQEHRVSLRCSAFVAAQLA